MGAEATGPRGVGRGVETGKLLSPSFFFPFQSSISPFKQSLFVSLSDHISNIQQSEKRPDYSSFPADFQSLSTLSPILAFSQSLWDLRSSNCILTLSSLSNQLVFT